MQVEDSNFYTLSLIVVYLLFKYVIELDGTMIPTQSNLLCPCITFYLEIGKGGKGGGSFN